MFTLHLGERLIIGGDYNAKHVDSPFQLTTTTGSELRKAVQETDCGFYTMAKPTYWPTESNKIPDLLHFFMSRRVSLKFIGIEENFDPDSGHSALILTLSENIMIR